VGPQPHHLWAGSVQVSATRGGVVGTAEALLGRPEPAEKIRRRERTMWQGCYMNVRLGTCGGPAG
jgi:hypothetical protein